MSLRGFHIVFITASTALALTLAVWCLRQYGADQDMGKLAGGVASLVAAAGLVTYGGWFLKKTGRPS